MDVLKGSQVCKTWGHCVTWGLCLAGKDNAEETYLPGQRTAQTVLSGGQLLRASPPREAVVWLHEGAQPKHAAPAHAGAKLFGGLAGGSKAFKATCQDKPYQPACLHPLHVVHVRPAKLTAWL